MAMRFRVLLRGGTRTLHPHPQGYLPTTTGSPSRRSRDLSLYAARHLLSSEGRELYAKATEVGFIAPKATGHLKALKVLEALVSNKALVNFDAEEFIAGARTAGFFFVLKTGDSSLARALQTVNIILLTGRAVFLRPLFVFSSSFPFSSFLSSSYSAPPTQPPRVFSSFFFFMIPLSAAPLVIKLMHLMDPEDDGALAHLEPEARARSIHAGSRRDSSAKLRDLLSPKLYEVVRGTMAQVAAAGQSWACERVEVKRSWIEALETWEEDWTAEAEAYSEPSGADAAGELAGKQKAKVAATKVRAVVTLEVDEHYTVELAEQVKCIIILRLANPPLLSAAAQVRAKSASAKEV